MNAKLVALLEKGFDLEKKGKIHEAAEVYKQLYNLTEEEGEKKRILLSNLW